MLVEARREQHGAPYGEEKPSAVDDLREVERCGGAAWLRDDRYLNKKWSSPGMTHRLYLKDKLDSG